MGHSEIGNNIPEPVVGAVAKFNVHIQYLERSGEAIAYVVVQEVGVRPVNRISGRWYIIASYGE
jgi:hypothetical protein